jgi:hypothetical protein
VSNTRDAQWDAARRVDRDRARRGRAEVSVASESAARPRHEPFLGRLEHRSRLFSPEKKKNAAKKREPSGVIRDSCHHRT